MLTIKKRTVAFWLPTNALSSPLIQILHTYKRDKRKDDVEHSAFTLRYGFHDVQEAHEEAAGLCLVQLVTAGTVAYERLRPCKLETNNINTSLSQSSWGKSEGF